MADVFWRMWRLWWSVWLLWMWCKWHLWWSVWLLWMALVAPVEDVDMEKKTERKSLLVHLDKRETLEMLDDVQAGKLFKMLLSYADDGTVPEEDDQVVRIVFSMMRQQMDHDAERYAETCQKRAENGRKGGRPKGSSEKAKKANGFLAFENKAKESKEKQTKAKKPDTDTDTETDTDTVTVCDCVTPRVSAREDTHDTQTAAMPDAAQIIELAKSMGYVWDTAEAEAFLAYNLDRGRTEGWEFAVQKWETNRASHRTRRKQSPSHDPIRAQYLSAVNRFTKEET